MGAILAMLLAAAGPQEPVNPFGVMIASRRLDAGERAAKAVELGAEYCRPLAILAEAWDGSDADADAARDAGLRLALTIRANGGGRDPTDPVEDVAAFRRTLGLILDRYHPALLVVENEENSSLFYTGTPEQYGVELRAAVEVAHARGVRVANGGLVSTLVCLLVWADYRDRGEVDRADSFARRVFDEQERRALSTPRAAEQIAKGRALLEQYRGAGLDSMNFHWYEPDPPAMEEAVAYLRGAVELPLICNEMGQHDEDPDVATSMMGKAMELELPIVIWYCADAPQARALIDPDGTLRPNGVAFQRLLRERFPR